MSTPIQTDTLIVGASAAGLATSACLARQGCDYLVVESNSQVANAWRGHYDRLHLHTPRKHSGLPYLPMPKSYPKYPARDQVVSYLEQYTEHHQITPAFNTRVNRIRRDGDAWVTSTDAGTIYHSQHVVIATGYTRVPHMPVWPGVDKYQGELMHSSAFSNGEPWKDKEVLVIGFGNSGGEIAIDLAEHGARPTLAVRSPVNVVPRDLAGVPILALGIGLRTLPPRLADALSKPLLAAKIGDIRKYGLRKLPYGPAVQIQVHGRIPLLDIGTLDLIKQGRIKVAGGIKSFGASGVTFEDGSESRFDAVICATGYRPALAEFLDDAEQVTTEAGVPTESGRELLPGLFFCGFYVSPAGMLREIGIEARRIAATIADKG